MHHSNCQSIHPFCRGLPFQPMGRRENTWKQKSAHTKKNPRHSNFQDSMPTMAPTYIKMKINKNVHNKVPKPREKKQHTKSQCRFVDCNLWFWGEYLRDVKAYVADGLQPERQIGSFPKIWLKLLKSMTKLLS